MNLMPETKEEQSRERVSSYDILLAESDVGSRFCPSSKRITLAFATSIDDTASLTHPTFSGNFRILS